MNYVDHYIKKKLRIKKVIGLIKGKLGGKLMGEFDALRHKTFSYLTDDNNENKKRKMCTLNLKIINIVQKQLNLGIK